MFKFIDTMKSYKSETLPEIIALNQGETVKIILPYTAGTGYTWELIDKLPDCLEIKNQLAEPASDAAGSGADYIFIFEAKCSGKSKIRLKYWKSWEGDSSIEKKITLNFDCK